MTQNARLLRFRNAPGVIAAASAVGKTEGEGPLGALFDVVNPDDGLRSKSWESAEAKLVRQATARALDKAGLSPRDVDLAFAGDLLNQCTASTFGLRETGIPFAGLFGACSTFAMALCLAAMAADGGYARIALAEASSHFCGAEKQFRYPLEYGGQRPPTAQRTVTGAGAVLLGACEAPVRVTAGMIGRVTDAGIRDAANMGAAMAPAAARTTAEFLRATQTAPADYDAIVTGDLGGVGTTLFASLLAEEGTDPAGVHADCGNLIFTAEQDAHAGGSGCGCSAVVIGAKYLRELAAGSLRRVLFVGTGALLSPLTTLQGESIPAVAHAVLLEHA